MPEQIPEPTPGDERPGIDGEGPLPRATFYENFATKRDCLIAAQEQAFERLSADLTAACERQVEWPAKLVAAVGAAIDFAMAAPQLARLLVVDAVAAEPAAVAPVLACHDFLVAALRRGREEWPGAASLPELTERALVGAISSVLGARLLAGQASQLAELRPQLVEFALMPYVGVERARELAEAAD